MLKLTHEPAERTVVPGSTIEIPLKVSRTVKLPVAAKVELIADEDEPTPDARTARWVLTREQVHAFIPRATDLVVGGRPLCPLCGRAVDADGHTCIKTNGHHPH